MGRRRNKHAERLIARRRIRHLLETARRRQRESATRYAERAVALARRIAMRYQTGLRPDERDQVCRGCGRLLAPGATARVRLRDGAKRITCLACGHTQRRGYRREQKERRRKRQQERGQEREQEREPPVTPGPAR